MSSLMMRFPNGKNKALTLSYDDGVIQDARLIKILQQFGIKATFNINSGCYAPEGFVFPEGQVHRRMSKSQAIEVYKDSGMEIAVHTLTHPHLEVLSESERKTEIIQDRNNLEADFECLVRGMAYPYGTYNDNVIRTLKEAGIVYARTATSTEKFEIPENWLTWSATCHHNHPRLMELANMFLENSIETSLFYLWGHSFEFERDDNWYVIEEFAKHMGNRNEIWYATNLEIYNYVEAYRKLIIDESDTSVYNPSDFFLYFQKEQKVFEIEPKGRIKLQ